MTQSAPTSFLPAERLPANVIRLQNALIVAAPHVQAMLDAMPCMVLVLNSARQTVFANKAAQETLMFDQSKILGSRPGKILRCLHSDETEGGCGTTEFCRECGAAHAIRSAQAAQANIKNCLIRTRPPQNGWELRVWATPFSHEGETFTIFAAIDISHENRRKALERIFLHDALNAASAVLGLSEMLPRVSPKKAIELFPLIHEGMTRVINEITAQRELAQMESGDLRAKPVPIRALAILEELIRRYSAHDACRDRTLQLAASCADAALTADPTFLMRVLGNMIKNALEAERPGVSVSVGCRPDGGDAVLFWVENPSVMPESVRLQVFQRSFSTKGSGRGLGTYSMKLIGERGLGGIVDFTSVSGQGTRFTLRVPAVHSPLPVMDTTGSSHP